MPLRARSRGGVANISQPEQQQTQMIQFVNVSDFNQTKDADLKRVVRANAMRYSQQKRKERKQKSPNAPSPTWCLGPGDPAVPSTAPAVSRTEGLSHDAWVQEGASHWPTEWDQTLLEVQVCHDSLNIDAPLLPMDVDTSGQGANDVEYLLQRRHRSFVSQTSPQINLGSGNGDPFNALPVDKDPHCIMLLNHFNTAMAQKCLPILGTETSNPFQKVWLSFTLVDPLLFQATTNFAAMHLDLLQGGVHHINTLKKKAKTISMVNERLASSEQATANSTIAAVGIMAAMETMNGNSAEVDIHLTAMEKMVRLRGGLPQLGLEGILHMFMARENMVTVTSLSSRPISSAVLRHSPFPDLHLYTTKAPSSISPNYLSPTDVPQTSNDDLTVSFSDVRYLTQWVQQRVSFDRILASMDSRLLAESTLLHLLESRSSLEQSLFATSTSQSPAQDSQPMTHLKELYRLGARIYLDLDFRAISPTYQKLISLKTQLIYLIQSTERCWAANSTTMTSPLLGAMLWVLFMGGILSLDTREETWFAVRIARVTETLGLRSFEEVEAALRLVFWASSLRSEACMRLWHCVETVRAIDVDVPLPWFESGDVDAGTL